MLNISIKRSAIYLYLLLAFFGFVTIYSDYNKLLFFQEKWMFVDNKDYLKVVAMILSNTILKFNS